jgi:hypothetical protein
MIFRTDRSCPRKRIATLLVPSFDDLHSDFQLDHNIRRSMQSRCPAGGTAFGSSNFETRCEQSPFAAGTRSFRAPAMANRLINLVASFRSVYPDKRPPEAVSHGDVASTCPQKMTRVSGPPNSARGEGTCGMNTCNSRRQLCRTVT